MVVVVVGGGGGAQPRDGEKNGAKNGSSPHSRRFGRSAAFAAIPYPDKWPCSQAKLFVSLFSCAREHLKIKLFENDDITTKKNWFLSPCFLDHKKIKWPVFVAFINSSGVVWKPRSLNLPEIALLQAFSFYDNFVRAIFCLKHLRYGVEVYLNHSPFVRTAHPVVWSPVDNLFWTLISIVAILTIYYQNIAFPIGELKTKEICCIFKAVIFQLFICVYGRQKAAERFCITPTR